MVIKKSFELFRILVMVDKVALDMLFERGVRTNWLQKIMNFPFIHDITEISVDRIEHNRLVIVFKEERVETKSYSIEFIKRPRYDCQDGYIEIKNNHPKTSWAFYHINITIYHRIIKNWDKAIAKAYPPL